MKLIYFSIFILLISCSENQNTSEINEIPEVNFKDELTKKVNDYKSTNEEKVASFEMKIDSIKSIINEIEFSEITDANNDVFEISDLASNYFFLSIHDYDTLAILDSKLKLQNIDIGIFRRTTFTNTPTQTERDLISLNKYLTNSTSEYDSDEIKLSRFSATTERIENCMTSKYVFLIKDYIYLEPKVGFNDYEPGEVVSGIFLYNTETNNIENQFIIRVMNDLHIQFEETGDFQKDQNIIKSKLNVGIKSNYDRDIKKKLIERYSLDEDIRIFF